MSVITDVWVRKMDGGFLRKGLLYFLSIPIPGQASRRSATGLAMRGEADLRVIAVRDGPHDWISLRGQARIAELDVDDGVFRVSYNK